MKNIISRIRPILLGIFAVLIVTQSASGQSPQNKQLLNSSWISEADFFQFVFHVNENSDHSLMAFFDIPAQESWGIPADCAVSDSSVNFDIYNIKCKYEGVITEDGNLIVGNFINPYGNKIPINLRRTENPPVRTSLRPQEPGKPYPYHSEEISFINQVDKVELHGTLTLPRSSQRSKAVVLITGSGGNDRDQLIYGHRVFLVLADYLTRQGIAVLRFDDRGIGRSGGNYDEATFVNFINDAMAAHEYLKSREEVDPSQTGLIGHSEGAAIAIIASSVPEAVSFAVLMSAPAHGFSDSERGLIDQFTNDYRNNGASEKAIQFKSDLLYQIFTIARDETDEDAARMKIDEFLKNSEDALMELSEEDRVAIETESIDSYDYSWFLSTRFLNILRYQPEPALAKIQCPLLVLQGAKDTQISYENLSEIEKMVKEGGNDQCTAQGFEDMNHLFQRCKTGQESEYAQIEETIAPKVLQTISDWIGKL